MELRAPVEGRDEEVLTADALAFVAELHRRFDAPRRELLAARVERQARLDAGELPDFLPETREVREGDWRVAPVPHDLQDRRVEITGPVDRKMVINALNSGARCFMADFEDANSPTWENCVEGQANLIDAIERTIELDDRREGVPAERRDRRRCSCARAAGTCPSGTSPSTASRSPAASSTSASTSSTTRRRLLERGQRAVLLPAEAGEPPRGAALERRLRLRRGGARPRPRARSRRPS